MHFLKNYTQKIIKHNFLYKYSCINLKKLPYIKKILLHFDFLNPQHKKLTYLLMALELISFKPLNYSKVSFLSVYLKIKKGLFINCRVFLVNKKKNLFIKDVLLRKTFTLKKKNFFKKKLITFSLKKFFNYSHYEESYLFLKQLPNLYVTVYTNAETSSELDFVLKLHNVF